MKRDFLRFKASDDVELPAWLSDTAGDTAVVHVHGMSGNGYENYFLDNMSEAYTKLGLALFTFDNRGTGIINHFRQGEKTKLGGSCFEIFEESVEDINGALDYLKNLGKTRFILQGHSLGASKVVHYALTQNDSNILGVILLAPTDMVAWAQSNPKNEEYLRRAAELLSAGKPTELVAPQCWRDKTPLSAQTYPSICKEGNPVDIFSPRADGALIGKINLPLLIAYGDKDNGIIETVGSIEAWQEQVGEIINDKTDIKVIEGAYHSFRQYEEELAKICADFVGNL